MEEQTPAKTGKRVKPDKAPKVKEEGGPAGPDPVRYGDWERKGIAVDF
jgi:hypothetical protein